MKNFYPELPEIEYKKTTIGMPFVVLFAKSLIGKYPIEVVRMAYVIFRNESANGKSGVNNNYCGIQADNARWEGLPMENVIGTSVKTDNAGDTRRFICFNWDGYKDCFDFLCYKIQQRKITDYQSYQDHWVNNPKENTPEAHSDFISLYNSALKAIGIIILIFISIQGISQIKFEGYASYFNPVTNIPDSVTWVITKEHLQGNKSKRVNKFHSSEGRQNLKIDYRNSGYDQGHNSPYDDNYYSDKVEFECFDYVNMFPQLHILNGGVWEKLEDHCRKLALQFGQCKVKTSWEGIDKKLGVDSVVVPIYCIKEIWFNNTYERYKMPNKDSVKLHNFTYYKF